MRLVLILIGVLWTVPVFAQDKARPSVRETSAQVAFLAELARVECQASSHLCLKHVEVWVMRALRSRAAKYRACARRWESDQLKAKGSLVAARWLRAMVSDPSQDPFVLAVRFLDQEFCAAR